MYDSLSMCYILIKGVHLVAELEAIVASSAAHSVTAGESKDASGHAVDRASLKRKTPDVCNSLTVAHLGCIELKYTYTSFLGLSGTANFAQC